MKNLLIALALCAILYGCDKGKGGPGDGTETPFTPAPTQPTN